jgi:hypothetical protein
MRELVRKFVDWIVFKRGTTAMGMTGIFKARREVCFNCRSEFVLSVLSGVTELLASPDFMTLCSRHHRMTTERLTATYSAFRLMTGGPVSVQTVSVAGQVLGAVRRLLTVNIAMVIPRAA